MSWSQDQHVVELGSDMVVEPRSGICSCVAGVGHMKL